MIKEQIWDREFYNIEQNTSLNIFMRVEIHLSTKINRHFQNGVAIGKKDLLFLYFCVSLKMLQRLVECRKILREY